MSQTVLHLDAKSVFAAVTATFIKQPAVKSLLCDVQYIKELLENKYFIHSFGLSLGTWAHMVLPKEQFHVILCMSTWPETCVCDMLMISGK